MSNGLSPGKSFVLRAGEILRIGSALSGMRAYLCVRGGLQAARVLGSCSSLAPLESGIELSCSTGAILARFVLPVFRWNSEPQRLRALPGPQAGSFPADAFYDQEFHVASTANRMGLRLHAKPLPCLAQELASEPVCPGSVQVMRDGQCTILGVDGQTIGGYPKIAQVISADVDKLAQLRPGTAIRFVPVSLNEARTLYLEKQSELHEWLTRLQITLGET
jgi:antagonist of KipI